MVYFSTLKHYHHNPLVHTYWYCKQYQLLCTNVRGGGNNTHTKRNIFNLQHCHLTQEVTSAEWDENTFQSFLFLFKYSKHLNKSTTPMSIPGKLQVYQSWKVAVNKNLFFFYIYPHRIKDRTHHREFLKLTFCKSWAQMHEMPPKQCLRLLFSHLEARPYLTFWLSVALFIAMIHAGIIATKKATDSQSIKHHYCCIQSLMSMSSGWRPTGDRLSSLSSPSCWEGEPGSRSLPLLNPFSSSS